MIQLSSWRLQSPNFTIKVEMASAKISCLGPLQLQICQHLLKAAFHTFSISHRRPNPVPPQHTVLILNESRQRHQQDSILRPPRLGGDGEDLGG